ncbi:MAG: hypothetical protein MJ252_15245 [archaeon]|nr:hypothetical protein [archaeon]
MKLSKATLLVISLVLSIVSSRRLRVHRRKQEAIDKMVSDDFINWDIFESGLKYDEVLQTVAKKIFEAEGLIGDKEDQIKADALKKLMDTLAAGYRTDKLPTAYHNKWHAADCSKSYY